MNIKCIIVYIMKNICSVCHKSDFRVKQLDDELYCIECFNRYSCLKCNRLYDGCMFCHKKLCDCIEYKIEYDYGGDLYFCIECFKKQDPEINLYEYFKKKYDEQLTLDEIQKIIKHKDGSDQNKKL